MATAITWEIEWMQASTQLINGFSEVVLDAGWRCTGTDDLNTQITTSLCGTCSFPQPAEGSSFTPYADLTQEQVLGWVWTNGVNKDETEAVVQQQLETQINPPVVTPPLPWTQGA